MKTKKNVKEEAFCLFHAHFFCKVTIKIKIDRLYTYLVQQNSLMPDSWQFSYKVMWV